MGRAAFDKPVTVYLPEVTGGQRLVEVHDAREAISALTQHGLGGYDMGNSVWTSAFSLVTKAALEPTPQNLRVAQLALEVLASEVATRH